MVFSRGACAILLVMALLAPAGATGASSTSTAPSLSGADDCGGGRDAGDTSASALPLVLPVASCIGQLPPGDYEDHYTFHGNAGDLFGIELRHPTKEDDADVCLQRPSGGHGWAACGSRLGDDSVRFRLDESGIWTLVVTQPVGNPSSYHLTVSANLQVEETTLLVGHPPLLMHASIAAFVGPGPAEGIDSKWYGLAVPSAGVQSALLEPTSDGFANINARFFDSERKPLVDQPCATRGSALSEWCTVPAGAAHVVVEASSGHRVGVRFTYFR